jgi:hypothetical protein
MEKSDILKFGKFKGKTWGELLDFEAGQSWLRWWSDTPSTGKYANFENKQKATIKEWLGDPKKDTRAGASVVEMSMLLAKLDVIINSINTVIDNQYNNHMGNPISGREGKTDSKWLEE